MSVRGSIAITSNNGVGLQAALGYLRGACVLAVAGLWNPNRARLGGGDLSLERETGGSKIGIGVMTRCSMREAWWAQRGLPRQAAVQT